MFHYFEFVKVAVADVPVGILPPSLLRIAQKLPVRNSWEFLGTTHSKVTDTVTDFYYFEFTREVLANMGYFFRRHIGSEESETALQGGGCQGQIASQLLWQACLAAPVTSEPPIWAGVVWDFLGTGPPPPPSNPPRPPLLRSIWHRFDIEKHQRGP